jgi:transposase-like protein
MNTRKIAAEYRMSHWAQIVQNRIESGLSIKAFCENAGFHENVYYYWQRKLREAACEELAKARGETTGLPTPIFAEVKLATRTVLPPSDTNNHNQVYIETAGMRIKADCGYPVDSLAYLVKQVMQLC